MSFEIDLDRLSQAARRALGPDAPTPARMMAARGIIPGAKPGEIVSVVAALAASSDAAVAEVAGATLRKLPQPMLDGALGADLDAPVVHAIAEAYASSHGVVERLLRMPRIGGDTLELLARQADERMGELIATNEQRMLEFPKVIEALYMNKRVRMSTADRLLELAVRNGIELDFPAFKEAAAAIKNELIAEPTPEPTFDDLLFVETDAVAHKVQAELGDEDTHQADDEGEEKVTDKSIPIFAQLAQMTVTQKIRRAMLGTSVERLLLVRDKNRLVAEAAAKSPLLTENDAARISASKMVSEEVLRIISMSREHTRSYTVKINLITNPRTPFTFAARLIPLLRDSDLRTIAKSKNVTSAVQTAAKRQLGRKAGGG
jgi:hypothetical protein